jgi:hypothetical protein
MAIRSFPLEIQLLRSRFEERPLLPLYQATACIFVYIFRDFRLERSDGSCNVYQSVKLSAR